MSHATEIVIIQSSEELRKDPSMIDPLLDHVKDAGAVGIYFGFTEENPSEAYLLIVWKTLEDHYALMKDPVVYPKMGEIIAKCVTAPIAMSHVHFEPDASIPLAFNSPLMSFTHVLKLNEGVTGEALSDVLRNLTNRTGPGSSVKTHGGCFGKSVERDEFVIVFGWSTIEDHLAIRQATGRDGDNIKKLIEYTERRVVHLKLKPYLKYEG